MSISRKDCCVLNSGSGGWGFEPLALQLSSALGVDVASEPRRFNYLLHVEDTEQPVTFDVFIPTKAIGLASDKRLLAAVLLSMVCRTPETHLLESFDQVLRFVRERSCSEWCLKYPTSCAASGHRLITEASAEPPNWPRPFVVQEFIRLERPEVYRTYCAAGELFGWVARRFPEGTRLSPWVAHARGARYMRQGEPPTEALEAARRALVATGLGSRSVARTCFASRPEDGPCWRSERTVCSITLIATLATDLSESCIGALPMPFGKRAQSYDDTSAKSRDA